MIGRRSDLDGKFDLMEVRGEFSTMIRMKKRLIAVGGSRTRLPFSALGFDARLLAKERRILMVRCCWRMLIVLRSWMMVWTLGGDLG